MDPFHPLGYRNIMARTSSQAYFIVSAFSSVPVTARRVPRHCPLLLDTDTGDSLSDSGALQRNFHLIDAIDPVERPSVTGPDHGLAGREQLTQNSGVEFRIPCHRNPRAQAAIVWLEGVLRMSGDVGDGRRPEDRIVDLSRQCLPFSAGPDSLP